MFPFDIYRKLRELDYDLTHLSDRLDDRIDHVRKRLKNLESPNQSNHNDKGKNMPGFCKTDQADYNKRMYNIVAVDSVGKSFYHEPWFATKEEAITAAQKLAVENTSMTLTVRGPVVTIVADIPVIVTELYKEK